MLTLHVGLHKTGTTSSQAALAMSTHRSNLHIWVPGMAGDPFDTKTAETLVTIADHKHVVVSSEALLGDCVNGYEDISQRAAELKLLYGAAQPKVVIYLRRQTDWLPSVYLQTVQEGWDLSPEDFWCRIKDASNVKWMNLLGALAKHFPRERIIVRVQDAVGDVVDDFFEVLQLGSIPSLGIAPIRENVSISATQAPLFRMVCRSRPMSRDELRLVRSFFQAGEKSPQSPRLSPFPKAIQSEIINRFADDWACVILRVSETGPDGHASPAATEFRPSEILNFAGSSLDDELIQAEVIQALTTSILCVPDAGSPSLLRRIIFKVRRNPRDVLAAFRRSALRRKQTTN